MNRHRGGRRGWRRRCEQSLAVDIRRLKARGYLQLGRSFNYNWSQAGESLGQTQIYVGSHSLVLEYAWTPWGSRPRPVRCEVPFDWTKPRFGGERLWLCCPRCGRRCVVVYAAGRDFACRLCLRLGFLTESMSPVDRAWHRLHKLEARLEEDGSKPKRMRWATYERLCARIEGAEERGQELLMPSTERLLKRLGQEWPDEW